MASNYNSSNNQILDCNSSTSKTSCGSKEGMYMVVDNGEKILLDVEEGRLQLQRQILSVLEKLYLLWDVVRKSLGLMIPILAGTTIIMMANNCLPSPIAFPVSSLVLGMIIGLIFITLGPLNEAIATFLEHKMFVPDILPCDQLKNLGEEACQWEHVDDDMVPPPSPSQVKEPTLD